MRTLYQELTVRDLFVEISKKSAQYALDARDHSNMKGKPGAIEYRLAMIKNLTIELQLRADEMKYEKTI